MIRALPTVERWRAPLPAWIWHAVAIAGSVALAVLALTTISARHEARLAEQVVCAARIETFYVRNPRLRAGRVQLVDACTEWRTVRP